MTALEFTRDAADRRTSAPANSSLGSPSSQVGANPTDVRAIVHSPMTRGLAGYDQIEIQPLSHSRSGLPGESRLIVVDEQLADLRQR